LPILDNPKFELFAQALAQGKSASAAYVCAGYAAHGGNAGRLSKNESIRDRVEELLHAGAERAGVTVDRVIGELAKIGFSDIRKLVRWQSARITEQDNPEGGDILVVKNIVTNLVEIIGSADVDDATAGAISEISQNEKGGVKIRLHDKRAALVELGKHLGIFKEKMEVSGPAGGPITLEALIMARIKPPVKLEE
jgi:phage terminase small subunit